MGIQCEMNHDKTDVMFDFNMPFEINDDNEILKRLGLSHAPYEELEKLLPKDIFHYCREHRLLDAVLHRPSYHAYPYYHPGAPMPLGTATSYILVLPLLRHPMRIIRLNHQLRQSSFRHQRLHLCP